MNYRFGVFLFAGLSFCLAGWVAGGDDDTEHSIPWRGPRSDRTAGLRSRDGSHAPLLHRIIQNREMAEQLGLEAEQVREIRERLEATGAQMAAYRDELQEAAVKQAALMAETPVNEDAVMAAIAEMGAIRTRIDQLRAREILFMQRTLTPDQRARAVEIFRARLREQGLDKDAAGYRGGERRERFRPAPAKAR